MKLFGLSLSLFSACVLMGCADNATNVQDEVMVEVENENPGGESLAITPANARIQFIGAHTNDRPDRVCGFEELAGTATFERGELTSISIEAQVESVFTFDQKLTDHLKSPDFFDAREYPTLKFESTKIQVGDDGRATISGKLTLMKETKEISIQADVSGEGDSLSFKSGFTIDRTAYGMDKMTEGVKAEVKVSFIVGEKTDTSLTGPAN